MIQLTPELEKKIEESGIPIVKITLQDLLQAKPIQEKDSK